MSKSNKIQRKSEHKIAFSHKMTNMHLRPSCIQLTQYATGYHGIIQQGISLICQWRRRGGMPTGNERKLQIL